MAPAITEAGATVTALGLSRRGPNPPGAVAPVQMLRAAGADVVQTWLYHGDLIGGFAARMAGVPVVWNIRHSDLRKGGNRASTIWTGKGKCPPFAQNSPRNRRNSRAAADVHAAMGYDRNRMQIIPNGSTWPALPLTRKRGVAAVGTGCRSRCPPVGLSGRDNPQKDHRPFIGRGPDGDRAARRRVCPVRGGHRAHQRATLGGDYRERRGREISPVGVARRHAPSHRRPRPLRLILGVWRELLQCPGRGDGVAASRASPPKARVRGTSSVTTAGWSPPRRPRRWPAPCLRPWRITGATPGSRPGGAGADRRQIAIEAVAETYAGLYRAVAGGGDS